MVITKRPTAASLHPMQDALAKAERAKQLAAGARAKARAPRSEDPGTGETALACIAACAGAAGPLALLGRCFAERGRVRVVTRHARGVRGAATGAHLPLHLMAIQTPLGWRRAGWRGRPRWRCWNDAWPGAGACAALPLARIWP